MNLLRNLFRNVGNYYIEIIIVYMDILFFSRWERMKWKILNKCDIHDELILIIY